MGEQSKSHIDPVEWGKMLQAVEDMAKAVTHGFDGVHKRLDTQNGRIGKLENWRWYVLGISTVIIFLVREFLK